MFERNPLAVKSSSSTGIGNSEPSGGGDSIADNFDVCNWRPDSETVASRAFAHASSEKFKSLRLIILHSQSDLVVETDWDLRPYFSISISAAFGPEGATTLFGGYTPGFQERLLEP